MYSESSLVGWQSGIWEVGKNTSDDPATSVFLIWRCRRFFQNDNQVQYHSTESMASVSQKPQSHVECKPVHIMTSRWLTSNHLFRGTKLPMFILVTW